MPDRNHAAISVLQEHLKMQIEQARETIRMINQLAQHFGLQRVYGELDFVISDQLFKSLSVGNSNLARKNQQTQAGEGEHCP